MFDNKTFNGIYYSRFIASWDRYGDGYSPWRFRDWLKSLGLPKEVINEISYLYENGKMELEDSASKFCESHPKKREEP